MPVGAGKRDHFLTIWKDVSTVPGATANTGQMVESQQRVCDVWASVAAFVPSANSSAVRGQSESWNSFHMNVDAKFVLTFPWVPDLDATCWATEVDRRGRTTRYNFAGEPLDDGGDLIVPVAMDTR
jgi:hypothetical protein